MRRFPFAIADRFAPRCVRLRPHMQKGSRMASLADVYNRIGLYDCAHLIRLRGILGRCRVALAVYALGADRAFFDAAVATVQKPAHASQRAVHDGIAVFRRRKNIIELFVSDLRPSRDATVDDRFELRGDPIEQSPHVVRNRAPAAVALARGTSATIPDLAVRDAYLFDDVAACARAVRKRIAQQIRIAAFARTCGQNQYIFRHSILPILAGRRGIAPPLSRGVNSTPARLVRSVEASNGYPEEPVRRRNDREIVCAIHN